MTTVLRPPAVRFRPWTRSLDIDPGTRQRLATRLVAEVEAWLAELPHLVATLGQQRGLELGSQIPHGSVSVVFRCRAADGRPAVLKMSPDRLRLALEGAALTAWGTAHVPAVIGVAEELGALLVEAIEPGTPLLASTSYPAMASIDELLRSLHATGAPDDSYPTLAERVDYLFASSTKLTSSVPSSLRSSHASRRRTREPT